MTKTVCDFCGSDATRKLAFIDTCERCAELHEAIKAMRPVHPAAQPLSPNPRMATLDIPTAAWNAVNGGYGYEKFETAADFLSCAPKRVPRLGSSGFQKTMRALIEAGVPRESILASNAWQQAPLQWRRAFERYAASRDE